MKHMLLPLSYFLNPRRDSFLSFLFKAVDRQIYFQDKYMFYQFTTDECTYLFCEYEGDEGWKNGVKLLLQLVPAIPPRINVHNR